MCIIASWKSSAKFKLVFLRFSFVGNQELFSVSNWDCQERGLSLDTLDLRLSQSTPVPHLSLSSTSDLTALTLGWVLDLECEG